jgi:hypothetical protein
MPRKGSPRDGSLAAAKVALEHFWGRTNGGNDAWSSCHGALKALNLNAKELRRLRLELPVPESSSGTTAVKIARCARMLELMEEG